MNDSLARLEAARQSLETNRHTGDQSVGFGRTRWQRLRADAIDALLQELDRIEKQTIAHLTETATMDEQRTILKLYSDWQAVDAEFDTARRRLRNAIVQCIDAAGPPPQVQFSEVERLRCESDVRCQALLNAIRARQPGGPPG